MVATLSLELALALSPVPVPVPPVPAADPTADTLALCPPLALAPVEALGLSTTP